MAAAVLLRSTARAAATTRHLRSRSGPANSNQIQVSAGMAASTGLRSGAGWFSTKLAQAPPPPPYHRLIHGRGIHNPTSPSTRKQLLRVAISKAANAALGMACTAVLSIAIYSHYWVKPVFNEVEVMLDDRLKVIRSEKDKDMKTLHSLVNYVKELEAENTKLKSALDAARSQGKV